MDGWRLRSEVGSFQAFESVSARLEKCTTTIGWGHWIVLQSIIYNVDKFKENGIPAPKKFSDLIHPKLKKRVVSRDFTNFTGIYPVVGLAHDFGGSEANITPGLEKLKEMDLHSFLGFSSQGPQLMEAGDVWASMLHAGWGVRLIKAGSAGGRRASGGRG